LWWKLFHFSHWICQGQNYNQKTLISPLFDSVTGESLFHKIEYVRAKQIRNGESRNKEQSKLIMLRFFPCMAGTERQGNRKNNWHTSSYFRVPFHGRIKAEGNSLSRQLKLVKVSYFSLLLSQKFG
jgi:hypothetical protein